MDYGAKNRYYGDTAKTYDAVRFRSLRDRFSDTREKNMIVNLATKHFGSHAHILDIACGTGRITEPLLNKGFHVTACDISPDMLLQLQQKLRRFSSTLELQEANAEALPFPDNYFDGVTCSRLFGHLPTDVKKRVLSELMRVSRNGVILSFPRRNPLITVKRFFLETRFKTRWHEWRKPNWNDISLREFRKLLRELGLVGHDTQSVVPLVASTTISHITSP